MISYDDEINEARRKKHPTHKNIQNILTNICNGKDKNDLKFHLRKFLRKCFYYICYARWTLIRLEINSNFVLDYMMMQE